MSLPVRVVGRSSPWGERKRLHSAGVRVSETTIDTAIEATRVTVNSMKKAPIIPGANRIGMNTAISDSVIETMVKAISLAPSSAASSRFMPASRWRMMFSITTMASSTTKPMAITSASRLRLLRV